MNIKRLRTAGLALVTMLGAAHLSTAEATPLVITPCDDMAIEIASTFCTAIGHDDWGSVRYRCYGDVPEIGALTCYDDE